MKLKHVLKRVITLLMCASMVINTINVGATEMGGGEGQPSVAAETGSTNLLKNGLFADTDGNGEADSWNYYHGDYAKASSSVLTDGGVEIACVSNVNERITLYQQNIATTDMEYILTGDVNIATLVSGGNITFKLTATDSSGKTEALTSDAYNTKGSQSVSKTFTITELSNVVKVKLEIIVSNGATMAVTLNNISLKGTTTQLELITDGTFETDVNGDGQADAWTYYKGASELADTVLVDGGGIKINCETKKRLTLHQTLLSGIETGKTYVLSGEVNVSATTYGALTVRYITQDSKGTQIEKNENANYKFTSTTDGWQNVFYEIPVTDANVTRIKVEIEVSAGATLTASVRDFSLVEKVEEVTNKNYIQNPEFVVEDGNFESWTKTGAAENYFSPQGDGLLAIKNPEDGTIPSGTFGLTQNITLKKGTYKLSADVAVTEMASNRNLQVQYQVGTENLVKESYSKQGTYIFEKTFTVTNDNTSVMITICTWSSVEGIINATVSNLSLTEVVDEDDSSSEDSSEDSSEGTTPEDDGNLIKNAAYTAADTESMKPWQYYQSSAVAGTTYTAEVTEGVLKVSAISNPLTIHQTVSVSDVDAIYTISGQMKAEELSGTACVRVRLNSGLDIVATSQTVTGTTTGTDGWVDFSMDFEVPNAYYDTNALYYNKDGIVYKDADPVTITGFKVEQYVTKGSGYASFRNLRAEKKTDLTDTNIVIGDADNTLIVNGGFDREYADFPRWWTLWESTGGLKASSDRANICVGTGEKLTSSQASIHIQNVSEGENSRGTIHQTVKNGYVPSTLPGQAVKLSQWVKTEGFTENKLSIRLQYTVNSGDKPEMTSKYIDVKSTQDWTYYEYLLDIPKADLATIKLEYMYDEAQGHVWIDEVSMTEYIRAKGILADTEKIVLAVGSTETFHLSFVPENTTVKELVSCASSDVSVVSVASVEGNKTAYTIEALKEGSVKLKLKHVDGAEKEIAVLVTGNVLENPPAIDKITTGYETTKTGTLPEGYIYSLAARPQYGTFVIENGNEYIYYPNNQFSGTDTLIVLVEKDGKTALVTVDLEVESKNETPVFKEFLVLANKGITVTGDLKASDVEGDALTFAVKKQPEKAGTLEVVTVDGKQCYQFTPAADFTGLDNSGVMQVTDAKGNVAEAVVRIYVATAGSEIRETVKTEHPRLLADADKFDLLIDLIVNNENIKLWFNRDVKASTDGLFVDNVYTPTSFKLSDGVRLDTTGSKNVTKLAFVYMVTGDEKYYEAAILELNALCGDAYTDWNPSHLLDVAMTANGVALAYDWLYNDLAEKDPDVLQSVEQALYEKCLVVADEMYDTNHMFVTNENNWNYVCNGGFVTTAMALSDHENINYIAKVDNILNKAYQSIQYGLPQYAPEGDSIEGISYWAYGTQYLVSLLASISSATTVENPFLDTPGLDLTALYPIYMTGKAGTYNYADNDMADAVGYLNLWFAEAYNEPSYTWYHKYYMANPNHKASIYDLLYYNPEYYNNDEVPELLDYFYTSQAVTAMRHDYDDANSSFLGFKGGVTGSPHGDLDIGSFVYDIYGIRWAIDMGKDDYNLLGYWELDAEGTRWNYYRKNALGHNTIVFNPEKGGNQTIGQYAAAVEKNINNPGGGYVILDMTDVYQRNAVDAKRGFAYFNRTQALVRDEFTLKDAGTAYWQMHTYAEVEISEDGKTATLTQDEKTIELRLFDENGSDYKFETMNAYAYGATEPGAGENANEGITKIFIKATDVQKAVFNVLLTPEGEKSPEVKALKDWVTYDFSTLKEDNSVNDEIGAVLSGYTLSLEGNIGVNFYMELEAEVAASETAYMEFILPNGTKEKVFVKDAVPVTEKGDESEPDKIYLVFSCEIASDEMTEEIKAQFIVDESTKSPVYSYTVKAYADYILKNEALYPAKAVDLVKAMLNYGAYSQQYFGTNENVLANEDLSEEDKFLPSSDENDQKGLLTKYKASAVTKEGLGTFASAYLVLESETTLKVRFKPAEGVNVDELTFTVEGAAAKTVMSGNDVMIVVENIKAQDLDKNYAFVATYGADELEFSCSTMSYGNVILNIETNEVYTTELKSLVCALYNYNQAADVYCEN